ncbi:MAG: uracil phosphoribosyltransferase [Bacteroidales bacterium]|nr:uracil phosphoribosyltransferase [Bacteroidales bacterium]
MKNLSKNNSMLNQYIAEIRDASIQKDSMRFRKNMERTGELFAFEISKTLEYETREVITPLGSAEAAVLKEYPILIPLLRAGVPMHLGLLNIFDKSESAFISAYRKVKKNKKFIIKVDYVSCPELADKTIIIADPMLATGASVVAAYKELLNHGKPKHTHIVIIIASTEGINYIKKYLPVSEVTVWVGAIDEELTAQAYIVPGLGDAGDLAFGSKN